MKTVQPSHSLFMVCTVLSNLWWSVFFFFTLDICRGKSLRFSQQVSSEKEENRNKTIQSFWTKLDPANITLRVCCGQRLNRECRNLELNNSPCGYNSVLCSCCLKTSYLSWPGSCLPWVWYISWVEMCWHPSWLTRCVSWYGYCWSYNCSPWKRLCPLSEYCFPWNCLWSMGCLPSCW